jgi:hypothetical protein
MVAELEAWAESAEVEAMLTVAVVVVELACQACDEPSDWIADCVIFMRFSCGAVLSPSMSQYRLFMTSLEFLMGGHPL